MKWKEGHIWELSNVKITTLVFQYKYVVLKDGSPERWEAGFNRIADLPLLQAEAGGRTDGLELADLFDRYTVNFSLYMPLKEGEYMRINGDPEELGGWNKRDGPIRMQLGAEVEGLTG